MSGALGTMVVAGVTPDILSMAGGVEIASTSGTDDLVSVAFSEVVTTTGLELSTSVSVSFSGAGVLRIVVGILEMVVSIVMGVGAGVIFSVSLSISGGEVTILVIGEVIEKVLIELVVMLRVRVICTVLGVSLIVKTMLVTWYPNELALKTLQVMN